MGLESEEIKHGKLINPMEYQKICKPEHFFKKFNGFGISLDILDKLRRLDIKIIRIVYLGVKGKKIYITSPSHYYQKGISYTNQSDEQRVLSISQMLEI